MLLLAHHLRHVVDFLAMRTYLPPPWSGLLCSLSFGGGPILGPCTFGETNIFLVLVSTATISLKLLTTKQHNRNLWNHVAPHLHRSAHTYWHVLHRFTTWRVTASFWVWHGCQLLEWCWTSARTWQYNVLSELFQLRYACASHVCWLIWISRLRCHTGLGVKYDRTLFKALNHLEKYGFAIYHLGIKYTWRNWHELHHFRIAEANCLLSRIENHPNPRPI